MNILNFLEQKAKYMNVINSILNQKTNQNIYVGNAACNLSRMLAALTYQKTNQNIIYVTENIYEASKAYETFCDLLDEDKVSFFPVEEFISSELVASSLTFRLARMLTIHNIVENNPKLIVTCTEGITKQMMSKAKIQASTIKLHVGQIIKLNKLVEQLVIRGYKKVSITEELGTFSVRGSIVDIYPINSDSVYRINFFDDEIETIKKVNIETQMSEGKTNDIYIFPLYEMYYSEEEIDNIEKSILKEHKLTEKVEKDLRRIKNYNELDQLNIYLPYIDPNYLPFIQLFNNPICFYEDINNIISHQNAQITEITEYLLNVKYKIHNDFFLSVETILKMGYQNIFLQENISSLNDIKLNHLFDLKTGSNFDYNNNIKLVVEDIKLNKDKTYIITHFDEKKLSFLKDVFENNNITYNNNQTIKEKQINLLVSKNAHGFIDYENQIEILTPHEFAPGKISKQSKYHKYYNNSTKIYNKDDIKPGDYVIHQEYGIGIYLGIETKTLREKQIDYLKIQYADEGNLYVPIENIYLLEKYNTSKDAKPKLNNLTGKEWKKKKARIKEKVMEVAKRLIKVQAERELKQGYIYDKDSKEQMEFESDFEFRETVDQIKAINEVKTDMESKRPLDRLVCGDVGFGKTEVAMRAAFKAVDNGKQVVYLAPTTVLTRQHYHTFKERFEKFGIRVELLNRFVPASKQKIVLEGITKGYVDIVIGTHRVLSKDLVFKNLGLLIVDEEQRFGVLHKERIKEIKANVDILTLTATPIPRTLQMALSGLRDLSLIETPPTNRLPVQTYVLESNDSVIREAINREMGRNGQIFYLLNRIEELDGLVSKIHKLCPAAKIGVIHGQMTKERIEDELVSFLDRKYDVLVCTTIIETGIDIPNANTLIIERADYLGLSQLYQIRGRVGRSDRISYAYLMYEPHKVLTQQAKERLDAIKEFTALGSGYKIAMKDLAIRGAGDILGDEQSGFIDAIGMDLYMKLLSEAINELKGIKEDPQEHKYFNISISKHIDPNYVLDDEIRIIMHKEISKIKSRDQIKSLILEYTDRYGKLNDEILLYMEEKYLEYLLKSKGIEAFKELKDEIQLNFDEETTNKINYKNLSQCANKYAPLFTFSLKNKRIFIHIDPKDYDTSYIYTLTKFLENIDF
ncbi:MAG: transcription-repair coupling factor [Bacilli bacterium]|nr:transcription-repair coupling factor [Bacilli bacterium]